MNPGPLHAAASAQVSELRRLSADPAVFALVSPEVSAWTVGEHVEHLALAGVLIAGAIERLLAGDPPAVPGGRLTWRAGVVLVTGRIPRGRAQAPERVQPRRASPGEVQGTLDDFAVRLAALRPGLATASRSRLTIAHPRLGPLRPLQWLRFLRIHQAHHLTIVADIRAAAARR